MVLEYGSVVTIYLFFKFAPWIDNHLGQPHVRVDAKCALRLIDGC